jgi:hypothetical protein
MIVWRVWVVSRGLQLWWFSLIWSVMLFLLIRNLAWFVNLIPIMHAWCLLYLSVIVFIMSRTLLCVLPSINWFLLFLYNLVIVAGSWRCMWDNGLLVIMDVVIVEGLGHRRRNIFCLMRCLFSICLIWWGCTWSKLLWVFASVIVVATVLEWLLKLFIKGRCYHGLFVELDIGGRAATTSTTTHWLLL